MRGWPEARGSGKAPGFLADRRKAMPRRDHRSILTGGKRDFRGPGGFKLENVTLEMLGSPPKAGSIIDKVQHHHRQGCRPKPGRKIARPGRNGSKGQIQRHPRPSFDREQFADAHRQSSPGGVRRDPALGGATELEGQGSAREPDR